MSIASEERLNRRLEDMRRDLIGNVYSVTIDEEPGKKGDPVARGLDGHDGYSNLVTVIDRYNPNSKPQPEEETKIKIYEITLSRTGLYAMAFAELV